MKKINFLCFTILTSILGIFNGLTNTYADESNASDIEINETNFPDVNFRNFVLDNFDSDSDGLLSVEEREIVRTVNCNGNTISSMEAIKCLDGIEYFPNVEILDCGNNNINKLDVRKLTNLTKLVCDVTNLYELDVRGLANLTELKCGVNNLNTLDLSGLTKLEYLDCQDNALKSLNVSGLSNLTYLECTANDIKAVNTGDLSVLECFNYRGNAEYNTSNSEMKICDYGAVVNKEYKNGERFNKSDLMDLCIIIKTAGSNEVNWLYSGKLINIINNKELTITVPEVVTTDNSTVAITYDGSGISFDLTVINEESNDKDNINDNINDNSGEDIKFVKNNYCTIFSSGLSHIYNLHFLESSQGEFYPEGCPADIIVLHIFQTFFLSDMDTIDSGLFDGMTVTASEFENIAKKYYPNIDLKVSKYYDVDHDLYRLSSKGIPIPDRDFLRLDGYTDDGNDEYTLYYKLCYWNTYKSVEDAMKSYESLTLGSEIREDLLYKFTDGQYSYTGIKENYYVFHIKYVDEKVILLTSDYAYHSSIYDIDDIVTWATKVELNGLHKAEDGCWYYYTDNKIDTSYTGLADNRYGTWYVKNGKLDLSYTGMYKNSGTWVYVNKGRFDTTYTGLAKNAYGIWYMNKGKLDLQYTGMCKNAGRWVYVDRGRLDTTYTGLANNEYGTWYMKDGKLDTTYTGMYKKHKTWVYINKGKLDMNYTGMAKNAYGWWYMKNGKLDMTYTGMAKNAYGWWYMKNGKLDMNYTGMAKNAYGWWYMKSGKLDMTYTGIAKNQYGTWYMKDGKLVSKYD